MSRASTEKALLLCVMLALAGCEDYAPKVMGVPQSIHGIPELKDCVYVKVDAQSAPTLHVIRCPSSATSTHWRCGKACQGSANVVERE